MIKNFLRVDIITGLLLSVLWAGVVLFFSPSLLRDAFSLIYLLVVPGYFLYHVIVRRSVPAFGYTLTYSVGLSLMLLIVLGLGLNTAFLAFGITKPFAVLPLTVTVSAVTLLLIVLAALFSERSLLDLHGALHKLWHASWGLLGIGIILPILAIGGANTLNNGGSNWLALLVLVVVGCYFLALVCLHSRHQNIYPFALFSIGLTILLGTSLRGWNITGHDIMQEYQVFQLTLQHLAWNMSYYQDAYNACLSITILPTVLHQLTSISPPYVYKFAFQLLFALMAPIIYLTFSRIVPKKLALLAGFVFLSFPTFLTDVMMLGRQEIALIFLGLSLQAGMDKHLQRTTRSVVCFIFLAGMIFAHYSTSYIAVVVLLGAALCTPLLRHRPEAQRTTQKEGRPVIYNWRVVSASLVLLIVWNGFVTHTAGNLLQSTDQIIANITHLMTTQTAKNPAAAATTPYNQYVQSVNSSRPFPVAAYYPDASLPTYQVAPKAESILPERSQLHAIGIPEHWLSAAYSFTRSAYGSLVGLLATGGMVLLAFMTYRRKADLPAQYVLIGLAMCIMIALQALVPALAVDYGLLRIILEGLVILAVPMVTSGYWLLNRLSVPRRWWPRVIGIVLVICFFVLSGVFPAITGGFKPALALSNSGFYYEAYYTHTAEISGAQWLVNDTPAGSRVYADEFARRKIITYSDSTIFAQPVLLPSAIPIDSYVFLDVANVTDNDVPFYYNNQLLFHTVPTTLLTTHKNLVYSAGNVKIYK